MTVRLRPLATFKSLNLAVHLLSDVGCTAERRDGAGVLRYFRECGFIAHPRRSEIERADGAIAEHVAALDVAARDRLGAMTGLLHEGDEIDASLTRARRKAAP